MDFPRLIGVLYRNFAEPKSLFGLIGYCQQFILSNAKTVKSTSNLLRKKKAPPWTRSCDCKTKDQKSIPLISKLLDYSGFVNSFVLLANVFLSANKITVLQMNSCEFEQPASCLLYTKKNYVETSEEYLKILSWVQEKQIYNYGPKIEKPEKELAQWSAKFDLDFKTKRQPRTIQTTINHSIT